MQTIKLSDEIMKEDKNIIEDLIIAAHARAKAELKSKTTEEIASTELSWFSCATPLCAISGKSHQNHFPKLSDHQHV